MPFIFEPTEIPEVVFITPKHFSDERGVFAELFQKSAFEQHGFGGDVVQINYSASKKNVLRGLHFQLPPHAQAKLVTVLEGEVFDVAVDIRKGSPTYGKWVGRTLTADEHTMLYVPEGFAHGYCVLSETAQFMYGCNAEYNPAAEGGIRWDDPAVGIDWPTDTPVLNERDATYPLLADSSHTFTYA